MNQVGHPYIASKLFQPLDWYHIAGSYLPDIVPFATTTLFNFEEIHEGGERLFQYLVKENPKALGLALGMLTHGTKYGVDKYSGMFEDRYSGYREEMVDLILKSTPNLTKEQADKSRFHNFLWWGIDVLIQRNEPDFVGRLVSLLQEVNPDEVTNILSLCFGKNEGDVGRVVSIIFAPLRESRLRSVDDLARLWRLTAVGLPEKDEVIIPETVIAFEYAARIIEPEWRDIVDNLVDDVRSNLEGSGFYGHERPR